MTNFKKILNNLIPDNEMIEHFNHKGWMGWNEVHMDSNHHNNIKNHIKIFLTKTFWKSKNTKKALEIACGNGFSTYYLSPFFNKIWAIDADVGWRVKGIEYLRDVIGKDKVRFDHIKDNEERQNYYNKFSDNYFDYIFMVRVGHFFDKPYTEFNSINEFISGYICDINQLHRILKKDGFICVSFSVNVWENKNSAPLYIHSNRNNENRGFNTKIKDIFTDGEMNQKWKNLRKLEDDRFVLLYPEIDNNTEFMFILKAIK